jgi:SHS2 domain-containing protein
MVNSKKFKFLDHRADMFIEAYGATFPEALENISQGLFETISDAKKLTEEKKFMLSEKAATLPELVTYLLNKVVSEGDAREMMFKRLKVLSYDGKEGKHKCVVEVYGQENVHKLGRMYVKAITHHEATVINQKGKWTIKILPDI